MISVVIASRNRQKKLLKCVGSILKNRHLNFEVIIVDQTKSPIKNSVQNSCVRYFHRPGKGKSKALNIGISKAQGSILAFTDDDCIVSKSWLNSIDNFFKQHRDVDAVFGQTFPYLPNNHSDLICPCCSKPFNKTSYFLFPIYHSKIGFGNNMAIKKNAIKKIGQFKEWLGPGTLVPAAEDADLIIRLMLKKIHLAKVPKIIVFHNNWLSHKEFNDLNKKYFLGEIGCYNYYSLKKLFFAKKILNRNFKNTTEAERVKSSIEKYFLFVFGVTISSFYYLIDRIKNQNSIIN